MSNTTTEDSGPSLQAQQLLKFASYRMPFGKHKGQLLIDLPEPYVVWFSKQGFPKGELGVMLEILYEIKLNGWSIYSSRFAINNGNPNWVPSGTVTEGLMISPRFAIRVSTSATHRCVRIRQ